MSSTSIPVVHVPFNPQCNCNNPPHNTKQILPKPPEETRSRKQALLRPHRPTNPVIWCGAALCVVFSLLLIIAGILILVVFLVIKPRHPSFDVAAASLNGIYLDSSQFFNGDFTFLANFSNPNRRIDETFEYVGIELYFNNHLIAVSALKPFSERRQDERVEAVHMISSEVYFPPAVSMELQRQVRSNRVMYSVRGTFRVKASLGIGHYSYWLYGRCLLVLTAPPKGVLVGKNCRTKR